MVNKYKPKRDGIPNSQNTDMATDYKSQISLLDKAHSALIEYQIKGADAETSDLIRRLEELRRRIQKEAGWHEVCLIEHGCAGAPMFTGPIEDCRLYVDILKEGGHNDLIVCPL